MNPKDMSKKELVTDMGKFLLDYTRVPKDQIDKDVYKRASDVVNELFGRHGAADGLNAYEAGLRFLRMFYWNAQETNEQYSGEGGN